MAVTFFFFFCFMTPLNWTIERRSVSRGRKKEIDKEEKKERVKERLAGRQT